MKNVRRAGHLILMGQRLPAEFNHTGVDALHTWGEADTFKCGHCQRQMILPPRKLPEFMCRQCMRPVCGPCAQARRCTPFEAAIERQLSRAAVLKEL